MDEEPVGDTSVDELTPLTSSSSGCEGRAPDADHVAIAERLFAAIEGGNVDAVRNLYTSDVVVWHNTDDLEQPLDVNLRVLRWMVRTLPIRRYSEQRLSATNDGFVSRHVLRGTRVDGRAVAIPACIVATCTGGRISRIDEYIDSAHVSQVTGDGEQAEGPRRPK